MPIWDGGLRSAYGKPFLLVVFECRPLAWELALASVDWNMRLSHSLWQD